MQTQNTSPSTLETFTVEAKNKAKNTIIWLHGLGANNRDFEDIIPELQLAHTRYVFPNAPIRPVTINAHMPCPAWYDIYDLDKTTHEDEAGICSSEQQIADLIRHEISRGIPTKNIILAGYSQGGAVALHTALRYPETLAGIIVLSAYLPMPTSLSQQKSPANQNIKIFMAHGGFDEILPINLALQSQHQLTREGYSVDWYQYSMGHQVCQDEITDLRHWLNHNGFTS